ncbi:phage baseplate assembly protein V [Enterobacter hormaechei]|uniref:phage baseplate assembly protein V n=1 Tax=Enterobacter hormaechei TaxID=158836 RepID=UPI002A76055F|nr:phage baseplate assembly protein V [Enterobacter hormaechei]MDY3572311.1 phage baseplate assembly protein V [Enterobacter hormaechei]
MADYTLADLSQRMARMMLYGNVLAVQVNPPRCRVTFGTDPITGKVHQSAWLRLAGIADDGIAVQALPTVGAPVIVLIPGGEISGGIVFPAGFTDDRPPPSDDAGTYIIRFGNGAVVSYSTDANVLSASLPDGGEVVITGNLSVTGEVRDKSGSMQQIRDIHNAHTHNEHGDGGGVTEPPNQLMQSEEEPGP